MPQSALRLATSWIVIVWMAGGVALQSSAEPVGVPADVEALVAALVERLGDSDFAVRENASEALIELGTAALPALEHQRGHGDPEVRFRLRHIIEAIHRRDREQRLRRFIENPDGGGGHDLPGWDRFRSLVGDGREARRLFAEAHRFEGDLIEIAELDPAEGTERLALRLQQIARFSRERALSPGNVAGIVFVACHESVKTPDKFSATLSNFCNQERFRTAIQSGDERVPLQRLLGAWMLSAGSATPPQPMLTLALQYDITEGVALAEQTLRGGKAHAYLKFQAIMVLAKLGHPAHHAACLESLLEDTAAYSSRLVQVDQVRVAYHTQIRDLALAALIHLHGEDPQRFGFPDLQLHPQTVIDPATAGFASDEKRAEARAAWRAFMQGRQAPEHEKAASASPRTPARSEEVGHDPP